MDNKETKEISPENIDSDTNKEIESVEIEQVPQPDYSYGIENQALDYKTSVRNQPNIRRIAFLNS